MGKSSNRKQRAREYREKNDISKSEWRLIRKEAKDQGASYGSTPVIRHVWKKRKYPREA
jgi:hypothetical protein